MILDLINQILQTGKSSVHDRRKIREYILQNFNLTPHFLIETSDTLTICLETVPIAEIKLKKNSRNLIPLAPFKKIFFEDGFFKKFLDLVIAKYLESKKNNQGFVNSVLDSYVNNARQKGDSWEYALVSELIKLPNVNMSFEERFTSLKESFDSLNLLEKQAFTSSAKVAVIHLLEIEPNLKLDLNLEIQKDDAGVKGDVRDIVLSREGWSLGLSAKNNNEAVKHSRISQNYNFLKEWVDEDCSSEYFTNSGKVFDLLKENKGKKWDVVFSEKEKLQNIYRPILEAFIQEISRIGNNPKTCAKLLEYLVGRQAFYKIIKMDRSDSVVIEAFDFKNELNIPHTQALPTRVQNIRFKENSSSTIIVEFDHDWVISFRIHNASAKIEASLKFDIGFVNRPFIYRKEIKLGEIND